MSRARRSVIEGLSPASYRRHALHDLARGWPETNCYVDLWIEVLHALGHEPRAGLGFTITQDFEGDQLTFFKHPACDLETLFGVRIQELSIFDDLGEHCAAQIARGHLPLVEVDGFYLPDTKGISYRSEHTKTTIAINRLDLEAGEMDYFHNAGFFSVAGEDLDALLGRLPAQRARADALFPYVEVAKLDRGVPRVQNRAVARALLRHHLARRPAANPIRAYKDAFPEHAARLTSRPMAYFHKYTFNTLRQMGANFELLASHLDWLAEEGPPMERAITGARAISEGAKTLQFQLARACARKSFDALSAPLETMAHAWDEIVLDLTRALQR